MKRAQSHIRASAALKLRILRRNRNQIVCRYYFGNYRFRNTLCHFSLSPLCTSVLCYFFDIMRKYPSFFANFLKYGTQKSRNVKNERCAQSIFYTPLFKVYILRQNYTFKNLRMRKTFRYKIFRINIYGILIRHTCNIVRNFLLF